MSNTLRSHFTQCQTDTVTVQMHVNRLYDVIVH